MVDLDPVDLRSLDQGKNNEIKRMLDDSIMDEYIPIHKNSKLFKFILYTTKIEIKSNSLTRLIYSTSLFEFALWIVGLLMFISSPGNMYLIWVLIIHPVKACFGFSLLKNIPKTYEIIENLTKNPNFEEDKIMELISTQIRETFLEKWTQNKMKLLWYLISTIIALLVDIVIFIVQVIIFGNPKWFLMQTSLLFIILVFIISDIIYFLWFFTLSFTFPDYMIDPIKKAIFGSINELKSLVYSVFRKKREESSSIN